MREDIIAVTNEKFTRVVSTERLMRSATSAAASKKCAQVSRRISIPTTPGTTKEAGNLA